MNWKQWTLIAFIACDALLMIGKTGTSRRYTGTDAVFAAIQSAFMIWLVVTA